MMRHFCRKKDTPGAELNAIRFYNPIHKCEALGQNSNRVHRGERQGKSTELTWMTS